MKKFVVALDLGKINKRQEKVVYLKAVGFSISEVIFTNDFTKACLLGIDEAKSHVEICCTKWVNKINIESEAGNTALPYLDREKLGIALTIHEVEVSLGKSREDLIDRDLLNSIIDRDIIL
ncbi:MAG: hypothetical protein ACRCX8_00655 [Sarcina sp.]